MADYSIDRLVKIYENLELELIKKMNSYLTSMKLSGTRKSDIERWQKSQLSQLSKFKRETRLTISRYKKILDTDTEKTLLDMYKKSSEKELKRLKRNYGKSSRLKESLANIDLSEIRGINDQRMTALLNAVKNDTDKAMTSIYRQVNDEYRRIIHDSAIEFNTGNKTIYQSVDLAQKDFLKNGITSIVYKNGANVNIRSYAEMALRTNGQRAIIQGEATIRDMLGIYTVRVSNHGITCPKCGKWQGQILIDDVYQDGKPDGKHQLLSVAISEGLLHPNCRHSLMTVDPEIDGDSKTISYTSTDAEKYKTQQKQRKLERELRELKRQKAGATSAADKEKYQKKIRSKSKQLNDFIDENDYLIRQREREKI